MTQHLSGDIEGPAIIELPLEHIRVLPLAAAGPFPNHPRLPVLIYRGAFALPKDPSAAAARIERTFEDNAWSGGWRNGIYGFHHFHSNSHEVLGCYSGSARVELGGPTGPVVDIERGDVVVLPAGTAHRKQSASSDFRIVGAYPGGQSYDTRRGDPAERLEVERRIASVPLPAADPVYGASGPLFLHWGEQRRAGERRENV